MPEYNVTSPDGQSYHVVAPEGATQEEVLAQVQSQHKSAQAAPQSSGNLVPQNVLDYYQAGMPDEQRRQLESDVSQGLIQLPQGMQLGQTAQAPGLVQKVSSGLNAAGLTGANAVLGTLGQISGSVSAITKSIVNGTYGTYAGAEQAGIEASNDMQRAILQSSNPLTQQYMQNVGETLAPLADIAPFSNELGIIGTSAKAAMPEAVQYVGSIKNPKALATQEAIAAESAPAAQQAAPIAQAAEAPKVAQSAAQEAQYQYKAPSLEDYPPQVAEQIKANKPNVTPEEASRHIEAASLPVPVNMTEGQGLQDPIKISTEQNLRGAKEDYARLFSDQNEKLKQNIDIAKQQAAPDVQHLNQVDAGQHIVDALKTVVKDDKEKVNQAYKDLADANGGKLPIDGKAFANDAISTLREEDRLDYLPNVILKKLEGYAEGKKVMNYNLFENMRTDIAAEMRKADRAGDGTTKYALSKVRDSLESLPITGEAENLKPLADRARMEARRVFEERNNNPAYSAVFDDETPIGSYSPLADSFIKKYVISAPRSNLEKLVNKLSSDGQAKQSIAGSVIDHIKSSAGIDPRTGAGNLTQAGYNKALTALSPKIDLLVDNPTADLLHQIGNVARYTQFQPRGSFVNNSNTATALMEQAAQTSAEHAANIAAGGVPVGTVVRKAAEYFGAKKSTEKAMNPLGKGTAEKIAESKPKEKLTSTAESIKNDPEVKKAIDEKKSNPKSYKTWLKSISQNEKTRIMIKAIKSPTTLTLAEKTILLAELQAQGNKND